MIANPFVRAAAVVACVVCMILSLRFILEIGAMGDAIGAWRGLAGYEKGIAQAQEQADSAMLRLISVQVFGGALAFVGFRREGVRMRWSPLFLVAFPLATFIVCQVIVAIAGTIQTLH